MDLERLVSAQAGTYDQALVELRAGRKTSHWMWWIFPQVAGLGQSLTSRAYALASADEARAYLGHDVLGPRLPECCRAALHRRAVPLLRRSAGRAHGAPAGVRFDRAGHPLG